MKRRDFFAASAAAGFGLSLSSLARAAEHQGKDLLELRRYTFASEGRRREFDEYLAKAAVPALNRAGVKPVGAFMLHAEDNPKVEIERTYTRSGSLGSTRIWE